MAPESFLTTSFPLLLGISPSTVLYLLFAFRFVFVLFCKKHVCTTCAGFCCIFLTSAFVDRSHKFERYFLLKAIGPVRGTIGPLFMNFLRASGPGSFSFLSQTSGSIFSPFHGPLSLEPLARRHVLFHFARGPFIPSLGPLQCWSLQRNIAYNYGILFSQCNQRQHM